MSKLINFREQRELPYNPSNVDIRQQTLTIVDVVSMIAANSIELWTERDFQRAKGLWTSREKSRLIESLLMRIPLPIFYLDGSAHPWKIIDGLQRLTTFFDFISEGTFALKDLEYARELEGLRFSQLPFPYRRIILNTEIQAYVINPGTPESVKFNIFQRINTSGVKLNRQELRNAYFSSSPAAFLRRLASNRVFIITVAAKISMKRMKDKEFVLRFFSFLTYRNIYQPPMDDFLDYCMARIGELTDNQKKIIEQKYNLALLTTFKIFGEDAFKVWKPKTGGWKSAPNIALFECWTTALAPLPPTLQQRLFENREFLLTRYKEAFDDKDFVRSITSEKTSKEGVELRFFIISNLIEISL
jgi:hypothetical protein